MLGWHVALTWPGREGFAMRNLRGWSNAPGYPDEVVEPAKWRDKRYEAMWPRWVETREVLGKERVVVKSLASGYLLVRFGSDDEWHDVRERCGTGARYLGGGDPHPVQEDDLARLVAACETLDGVLAPLKARAAMVELEAGDTVRMLLGPFQGQLGTVVWVDDLGARIELTLFGRPNPCWFPHNQAAFEKVERAEVERCARPRHLGRKYKGRKLSSYTLTDSGFV